MCKLRLSLFWLLVLVFCLLFAFGNVKAEIFETRLVDDSTGFVQDIDYMYTLQTYYLPYLYSINSTLGAVRFLNQNILSINTSIRDTLYGVSNDVSQSLYYMEAVYYNTSEIFGVLANSICQELWDMYWHLSIISDTTSQSLQEDVSWREQMGWKTGLEYLASLLTNFYMSGYLSGHVWIDGGTVSVSVEDPGGSWADTNVYEQMDSQTLNLSDAGRASSLEAYGQVQNRVYDEEPQSAVPAQGAVRDWGMWTRYQGQYVEDMRDQITSWTLGQSPTWYLGSVHFPGGSWQVELNWNWIGGWSTVLRLFLLFLSAVCAGVVVLRISAGVLES